MSDLESFPVEDVAPSPEPDSHGRTSRWVRWMVEWVGIIVLAGLIAFGFRTFVAQTFYIPSLSMYPTLQIGDRIVVSKLSVAFGTINRGDIVVFHSPSDVAERCDGSAETYLVKRVIGLPGDHLSSSGTTIYVNGHKFDETWVHSAGFGVPIRTGTVVPANHYFMIGDNNFASCDSRYWGTVSRSAIIGKVVFRIWPPSRIGFVN